MEDIVRVENAILAVMGAAILVWFITAAFEKGAGGLTYPQALRLRLFRFLFGVRLLGFKLNTEHKGATVFALLAQSSLDKQILKAFLPAQTFHIDATDPSGKLDPNTMTLLKSVMAGHGTICLHLPPKVETSPGTMLFLQEAGKIAREVTARIVPLYIRGSRFSRFSFWSEKEAPRSFLPQAGIAAAPEYSLAGIREELFAEVILDSLTNAKFRSVNIEQTLFEGLAGAARIYGPSRPVLEDALGGKLSYRKLLIGARALGGKLTSLSRRGEAIGLLLPSSNGIAVTMFATLSAGRVAAMLNYTAGRDAVLSALKTANISTVITSKAFIEKADLGELVAQMRGAGARIVYLEALRLDIGLRDKLTAFVLWRRPLVRRKPTDPAVVLFTSGSEGAPKGVVLSSRNLLANAAQVDSRIDFSSADTLFNVLPLFHSFGLLGGAILPLLYGVRLFLYPSPLHYKLIPTIARKIAPTVMFGTDTFLNGYARAAKDGDLDSVRMIVAGAEAVKTETRTVYRDRFDAMIVEGYGMTEASPVVAVNAPGFSKDGSVGKLLTGMEMRLEPVEGIAEGGRLSISGPNLMLGYLLADKPGVVQPPANAWHDTGDIVAVDEHGFITIKGRAKRFAKIAGEMISLGAVEARIKQLWPDADHAAVAMPDKRRGERIALVTTQKDARKDDIIAHFKQSGAAEMMIPDTILSVETIPTLGSGKIDYTATSELLAGQAAV